MLRFTRIGTTHPFLFVRPALRSLTSASVAILSLATWSGLSTGCSQDDGAEGMGTGGTGTGGGAGGDGSGGTIGGPRPVAGTEGYDCSAPTGSFPPRDIDVIEVASGFDFPVFVTHAPGDDGRLFVMERKGVIRVVENETVLETPFLDISDRVRSKENGGGSEQGSLGLAFHPAYDQNGLFYVHYSEAEGATGATVIAEYQVSDDENVAQDAERIVLREPQPASNHNGGSIVFGSDGYLYVALGDGGGGYDRFENGQDESTLLGAILRINPLEDGASSYSVPATGNLVDDASNAAPEVWDYGLRNPYRINFDGCTGDLYIADVGQDVREELNVELAGEGRKNYGWPIMEGAVCTPEPPAQNEQPNIPDECGDTSEFTLPQFDYPHETEAPSAVAGAVYRGSEFPALRGTVLWGDYGAGRLWMGRFDRDANELHDITELTPFLGPIPTPGAIQNGSDGEVYIVSSARGELLRLVLTD